MKTLNLIAKTVIDSAQTLSAVALSWLISSTPAIAEWSPQTVVDHVYEGIQHIHGYNATPELIWGVPRGIFSSCGEVMGSLYCPRDHTVYITETDIYMAYQYGDAALAYIISHEYAHAMQIAHQFDYGVGALSELQADCLAGFYLGVIPNVVFDQQDIGEITSLAYHLGDYYWGSEHHHGTPKQRVQAVVLGIQSSVNEIGIRACLN
jgi:predicted metalloprotease